MLSHSDTALWYATAIAIVAICLAAGYGFARMSVTSAECEMTMKDAYNNSHVWVGVCKL